MKFWDTMCIIPRCLYLAVSVPGICEYTTTGVSFLLILWPPKEDQLVNTNGVIQAFNHQLGPSAAKQSGEPS